MKGERKLTKPQRRLLEESTAEGPPPKRAAALSPPHDHGTTHMTDKPLTIMLFTKDAEISDDMRALMMEHGYMPILVADLSAVKVLDQPMPAVSAASLDAISAAALRAVLSYRGTQELFGKYAAESLLATPEREAL